MADTEITAKFLKKGTPKAPEAEPEPKRPEEHKDMEISDDEVEIQPVVGQKRLSPHTTDMTPDSKR